MRVRAVPLISSDHSAPLFTILCLENICKFEYALSNSWFTKAKIICTFLQVHFCVLSY